MEISKSSIQSEDQLFIDLRHLIEDAKTRVASVANAGITMLYWHIGERINRDILGNQRAEYGKQIVATLSRQLQLEYGGMEFSTRNLRRMMQFASLFPNPQEGVAEPPLWASPENGVFGRKTDFINEESNFQFSEA